MNKKIFKIMALAFVFCSGIWVGTVFYTTADGAAIDSQPGSGDDPVVTKSYVDQQLQKLIQGDVPKQTGNGGSGSSNGEPSASRELQVVDIKIGEKLMAKSGAEFIVRKGKAIVYSETDSSISDLTDGKDIGNGSAVANNHLLLFPRDGRGLTPDPNQKNGLTVMVRGGYEIK